jgi:hypothetical protein
MKLHERDARHAPTVASQAWDLVCRRPAVPSPSLCLCSVGGTLGSWLTQCLPKGRKPQRCCALSEACEQARDKVQVRCGLTTMNKQKTKAETQSCSRSRPAEASSAVRALWAASASDLWEVQRRGSAVQTCMLRDSRCSLATGTLIIPYERSRDPRYTGILAVTARALRPQERPHLSSAKKRPRVPAERGSADGDYDYVAGVQCLSEDDASLR